MGRVVVVFSVDAMSSADSPSFGIDGGSAEVEFDTKVSLLETEQIRELSGRSFGSSNDATLRVGSGSVHAPLGGSYT